MSRSYKILVLIGGLALISLAFSWNARRELQSARRDLAAVTTANEFLKRTLGDMTVAITAKDREIERLKQTACDTREKDRNGKNRISHLFRQVKWSDPR